MTDTQEAVDNLAVAARQLAVAARQFAAALADAINEAVRACHEIMASWQPPESWAALLDYPKVLAQATPKELHYILNAKKVRTRKKYYNRVKRRIKKDSDRA